MLLERFDALLRIKEARCSENDDDETKTHGRGHFLLRKRRGVDYVGRIGARRRSATAGIGVETNSSARLARGYPCANRYASSITLDGVSRWADHTTM